MKKILIVPMPAMAETAGPGSRCRILAEGFKNAGMEVCTCMARDVNYIELDGIKNYKLEIPTPMGMPKISAKFFFPLVQKLGITSKKTVKSFEQVLFFTGNLDKRYLSKSVEDIRSAIRDFEPDIVYSEFNISALIAAKLEHVRLYTTVSFPTQMEYACEPKLAKGLNKLLGEWGLPKVSSALELFEWADEKFCPSIPELEPFDKKVTYIGTMKAAPGCWSVICWGKAAAGSAASSEALERQERQSVKSCSRCRTHAIIYLCTWETELFPQRKCCMRSKRRLKLRHISFI